MTSVDGPGASIPVSEEQVRDALRGVVDPELGADIVELGMVTAIRLPGAGAVEVEVALTIAGCPLRNQIRSDVETHVGALPGVETVTTSTGVMDAEQRKVVMARARLAARNPAPATDIPDTARVIAIASGKGGVGKSSVTVNLAVAMARRGLTVGVLDADIWGFSIPRLLGMQGEVESRGKKMVPLERRIGDGLLRVLSMGFLADEDSAIMWRGLVLNRAVQQFLEDVHWGDLDYLLIDMPPGTGDIQMGLARMLPRTEVIVVTTPPVAAQKVAARTADMARKGYLRVAGVIENMSDFTCEHGTSYALFGSGGGERLAAEVGVPLIGQVPIHPSVAAGGDAGTPVALEEGSQLAEVFAALAEEVVTHIAPVIPMEGCSARLLEHIEAAVEAGALAATPSPSA
ncbi:MAG TPA: Mrp/NBP35 family ATP-binding protein [Acidimicrobiales bacterium]|jgi:ATP-binding protein involved in chromosome partitioning|nr:Mrp/NBP35 family ATP-binding protein [Acidimicrobiales bacterium]